MKKVLPITESPFELYHSNAYPLTIILNNKDTMEWLYCNYIHLFYIEKQDIDPLWFYCPDYKGRFYNSFLPWLDYQVLDKNTIKDLNIDILSLVKYSIDNEQYVSLFWDEFYIPNGIFMGDIHIRQRALIYGYDDASNHLYTYSEKSNSRLETCLVSYEDFKLSFYSSYIKGFPYVYIMKLDVNRQYKFDVKSVITQIKDYLSSRDITESQRESFNSHEGVKFGFSIYDCIRDYLNTVSKRNTFHYHKTLNILSEHKKIMLQRIQYMQNNGYLEISSTHFKDYETVYKTSKVLGSMFQKYNISRDEAIISRIILKVNEISVKEKAILNELVDELSMNSFDNKE